MHRPNRKPEPGRCADCVLLPAELERDALVNLLNVKRPGMGSIRRALHLVAIDTNNLIAAAVLRPWPYDRSLDND